MNLGEAEGGWGGDEEYKIMILTVLKSSLRLVGFCLPYLY